MPDLDRFTREEIDDLVELFELVTERRLTREGNQDVISGTAVLDRPDPGTFDPKWLLEPTLMVTQDASAVLFGAVSGYFLVRQEYQKLSFSDESLARLRHSLENGDFPVSLDLVASRETRVVMSLLETSSFQDAATNEPAP